MSEKLCISDKKERHFGMKKQGAVLLNIGNMIDLAIGTPEVGTVDFNMLQAVLHCLAQQLRVLGKNVELRSGTALASAYEPAQTINVKEFFYDTEDNAADPNKPTLVKKSPLEFGEAVPPDQDTLLVVERVKMSESTKRREGPGRRSDASALAPGRQSVTPAPGRQSVTPAPGRESVAHAPGRKSVTGGPEGGQVLESVSLVTASKFNILQEVVDDLRDRVYGSIPKNEDILEEVRSSSNLKAITDMWTNLNVSSRLEAAETGLGKLSSLVQDLIAQTPSLQTARALEEGAALSALAGGPGVGEAAGAPGGAGAAGIQIQGPTGRAPDLTAIKDYMNQIRADLDGLISKYYDIPFESAPLGGGGSGVVAGGGAEGAHDAHIAGGGPEGGGGAAADGGGPEGGGGAAEGGAIDRPRTHVPGAGAGSGELVTLMHRLNELEKRLKECCDHMNKDGGLISDQLSSFQDQLDQLHRDVGTITNDLGTGKISPDLIKDLQGLMELFQTVQDMQEKLNKVHETALQLAAEKEGRHAHMNALLEQIELLKIVKLDKEDMVEAMADKADLRMLARKVSHDQFESACDDLSRGLEHAIGKLGMQETLWQQALDDIQREIETKLDKMELSPVKDFFNQKLRQLQENLKAIAAMRKEVEAAGSKRKLLRDVNCISCDAQAVMPMESTVVSAGKPLPPSMSMKPYLTYELDTIRKQQAAGGGIQQRNMNDWETIDRQMGQAKPSSGRARSATDKHLCNRYCGGSHTVTTPAQRVARTGHFIRQWGPEVLPLSSGFATGDDGRLYKISVEAEKPAGPGGPPECTPRKSDAKKSDAKPQGKPITISAECRCLEGDYKPAK